jgi:hypothetical protein
MRSTRIITPRGPRRLAGGLALMACLCVAGSVFDAAAAVAAPACSGGKCTVTFGYTGSLQEWQVPAGISSATFEVQGAGGEGSDHGTGGNGAKVSSTVSVTEKTSLKLVAGAGGAVGSTFGGGSGCPCTILSTIESKEVGGGGSFVFSQTESLMIAAGGGGSAGVENNGGDGGQTGTAGTGSGGGGATAISGGTGGAGGQAGQGPTVSTSIEGKGGEGNIFGGGGGGGLYGGGGGGAGGLPSGGGGGGSSSVNEGSNTIFETGKGGAGGAELGPGQPGAITITFNQLATNVALATSSTTPAVGQTVTYTATVSKSQVAVQ